LFQLNAWEGHFEPNWIDWPEPNQNGSGCGFAVGDILKSEEATRFFLGFGATLEQAKDGPFLVSATKATTWIDFATGS
jgi:hypothetical protein